ncbi:MAG: hypothetical protein H5U19_03395 [Rhodobacteraceae bacterium]|jgi:hypothetical protein|nr:hypothetical protein [Paracoccaceae bacterium]
MTGARLARVGFEYLGQDEMSEGFRFILEKILNFARLKRAGQANGPD